MAKIKMKTSGTIKEQFEIFLLSKQAAGITAKTVTTYRQHLSAVSKYLDINMEIDTLSKADLDKMIVAMRGSTLSPNSISSYTCTLKAFFSWCNEEGLTSINMKRYKRQETIKETYSDKEPTLLLKKPNTHKCGIFRVASLDGR